MKNLKSILAKHSGRGAGGKISVRHQGGRQKRFLREINFKRSKRDVLAKVETIEYDPNRTANIALLLYKDGARSYILAPEGLKVGDRIQSGSGALPKTANALPLGEIPVGSPIHNIEINPGKGGQIVRAAGTVAIIQGREPGFVLVKMPSNEIRRFPVNCFATIGQVARVDKGRLGLAGRRRRMGRRPRVRGVAMHPGAHPHGGGEGRSGEGMPPKTPWGKAARGVKTRKTRKYSDRLIVTRRRIGYGSK